MRALAHSTGTPRCAAARSSAGHSSVSIRTSAAGCQRVERAPDPARRIPRGEARDIAGAPGGARSAADRRRWWSCTRRRSARRGRAATRPAWPPPTSRPPMRRAATRTAARIRAANRWRWRNSSGVAPSNRAPEMGELEDQRRDAGVDAIGNVQPMVIAERRQLHDQPAAQGAIRTIRRRVACARVFTPVMRRHVGTRGFAHLRIAWLRRQPHTASPAMLDHAMRLRIGGLERAANRGGIIRRARSSGRQHAHAGLNAGERRRHLRAVQELKRMPVDAAKPSATTSARATAIVRATPGRMQPRGPSGPSTRIRPTSPAATRLMKSRAAKAQRAPRRSSSAAAKRPSRLGVAKIIQRRPCGCSICRCANPSKSAPWNMVNTTRGRAAICASVAGSGPRLRQLRSHARKGQIANGSTTRSRKRKRTRRSELAVAITGSRSRPPSTNFPAKPGARAARR